MKKFIFVLAILVSSYVACEAKCDKIQYTEKTMRVYCKKLNASFVGVFNAPGWEFFSPESVLKECLNESLPVRSENCGYKFVWANESIAIAEVWVKTAQEDEALKIIDDIYEHMLKTWRFNDPKGNFLFKFVR